MAQFIGSSASLLEDREYTDLRSRTAQQPYEYITRITPSGRCPPKDLPYTCGWNEGGKHMTENALRIGAGLTRERGAPRPSTQLVGPVVFQQGNGDQGYTNTETELLHGTFQPLRGDHVYTELNGCVPFQYGQAAWRDFDSTAERSRHKYEYSTACTFGYVSEFAPGKPAKIEPFFPGGEQTRQSKDF